MFKTFAINAVNVVNAVKNYTLRSIMSWKVEYLLFSFLCMGLFLLPWLTDSMNTQVSLVTRSATQSGMEIWNYFLDDGEETKAESLYLHSTSCLV